MRYIIPFVSLLFIIISCNETRDKADAQQMPLKTRDSLPRATPLDPGDSAKSLYVQRTQLEVKNFSIAIKSLFSIPDQITEDSSYYLEGLFLMIHNKRNNHS